MTSWSPGSGTWWSGPGEWTRSYFILYGGARDGTNWTIRNRPCLAYVGRVSKEKSVDDFCELAEHPEYSCWVVGDGPYREELEQRFGDRVTFVGFKRGQELAQYYASADVMVFPSRTDTFGNVITESMACGDAGCGVSGHRADRRDRRWSFRSDGRRSTGCGGAGAGV